ncbi:MAG: type II toxin-antitoxin system HigB family toxin [Dyadobacter fermentans]
MVILTKSILNRYASKYPAARKSIDQWYDIVRGADWSCPNDVKKFFNSADYVGNHRFVFNISGNDHRLITVIHFRVRTLYIVFLGTHSEYDRIDASIVKYQR